MYCSPSRLVTLCEVSRLDCLPSRDVFHDSATAFASLCHRCLTPELPSVVFRYDVLQRNIGTGFTIQSGLAVYLYRSLSPFPVTLSLYRALFSLMIGADAAHVVTASVECEGNRLPDPIATLPIRHPSLVPIVWKLLARAEPRVQAIGLRDWSCLLLGMDDTGDNRVANLAAANREIVKALPDWIQWFLGMGLPQSLNDLYEPLTPSGSPADSVPGAMDSHLAIVVQQLCARLDDEANTVPVTRMPVSVLALYPCPSSL